VIESISGLTLKGIQRDRVFKKREYEKEKIPEYYILDVHKPFSTFYRWDPKGKYEEIPPSEDGVIRSSVLPNFAFRLEHLKTLPSFDSMMNDPVYSSYLMLKLKQEREKNRASKGRGEAGERKNRASKGRGEAGERKNRASKGRGEAGERENRASKDKSRKG